MLTLELLNKIIFLNIICFSLLILVSVLTFKKAPSVFKLKGTAFFSPVFIGSFSFLLLDEFKLSLILIAAELSMGLTHLLIFNAKKMDKSYNVIKAFAFTFPVLLSLFLYNYYNLGYQILSSQIITAIFILVFSAVVFLNKKVKSANNAFFEGLVCLIISFILRLFENNIYLLFIAALFSIAAYWSFFRVFFKSIHKEITSKLTEAEKIKASLEDSVKYEVKTRTIAIERSNEQLITIAKTDQLTKAYNKLAILNIIESMIINKKEKVFSVLMFDIDYFKGINDTYGHVSGDMCIKALASIAKANIRNIDYLGRYGGDEFVIVLPSLNVNDARLVGDRFRRKVSEGTNPKFSVSIGVATYPEDGITVKDIISAADKGLYRSKERGRNAISHQSLF